MGIARTARDVAGRSVAQPQLSARPPGVIAAGSRTFTDPHSYGRGTRTLSSDNQFRTTTMSLPCSSAVPDRQTAPMKRPSRITS